MNNLKIDNKLIKEILFSNMRSDYKKADCMIIYGCHIKPLLIERLEYALKIYKEKEIGLILLTGGKGLKGDFNEAEFMEEYLLQNGIDKDKIMLENKSATTKENVENSLKLLNQKRLLKNTTILNISNQFHIKKLIIELNSHISNNVKLIYDYPDESIITYEAILKDDNLKKIAEEQVRKVLNMTK